MKSRGLGLKFHEISISFRVKFRASSAHSYPCTHSATVTPSARVGVAVGSRPVGGGPVWMECGTRGRRNGAVVWTTVVGHLVACLHDKVGQQQGSNASVAWSSARDGPAFMHVNVHKGVLNQVRTV